MDEEQQVIPDPARTPQATAVSLRWIWPANLLVWLISGGNFVAFKLGAIAIPPFTMAAGRLLFSGTMLMLMSRWFDREVTGPDPIGRSQMATMTGAALFTFAIGQGVFVWGVAHTPASVASVLGASSPIFLGLITWAVLRRPLQKLQWVGIVLGFAGCVFLVSGKSSGGPLDALGVSAVLIGAGSLAIGLLMQKMTSLPRRKVLSTGIQMFVAALMLLLVALFAGEFGRLHWNEISTQGWIAFAYMSVPGSLISFSLILWLARTAPSPMIASSFAYAAPAVAIILAAQILDEPVTLQLLGGAALALAGAALMGERKQSSDAA